MEPQTKGNKTETRTIQVHDVYTYHTRTIKTYNSKLDI